MGDFTDCARIEIESNRWEIFKCGLDLYEEKKSMLSSWSKENLVESLLEDWDIDECLEDELRDIYDGEY